MGEGDKMGAEDAVDVLSQGYPLVVLVDTPWWC